jgi:hypothetical protein
LEQQKHWLHFSEVLQSTPATIGMKCSCSCKLEHLPTTNYRMQWITVPCFSSPVLEADNICTLDLTTLLCTNHCYNWLQQPLLLPATGFEGQLLQDREGGWGPFRMQSATHVHSWLNQSARA